MKNNSLTFSPQALALKPFRALWDKDKTKSKEKAIAELSYVWFMEEASSPFFNIINEEERSAEIISVLSHLPKSWKPNKEVNIAIGFYRERNKTISEDMLRNTIKLLAKISDFIGGLDPAETYEAKDGRILYKNDVAKLVATSKQIPELLKSLRSTRELVKKDREEEDAMRGSREKAVFEDGA